MKRIILTVVLGGALLTACGNGPESGLVTDTWHEPMEIKTSQSCSLINKVSVCRPTTRVEAEEWRLELTNADDDGWRSVSRGVYDLCHAGLHYPECAEVLKAQS